MWNSGQTRDQREMAKSSSQSSRFFTLKISERIANCQCINSGVSIGHGHLILVQVNLSHTYESYIWLIYETAILVRLAKLESSNHFDWYVC